MPGKPGECILGRALEVLADRVLERAVVDRVELDLGPAVGSREGVDYRLRAGLGARVGVVAAERHRAARGGDAGGRVGGASATCGDEGREAAVARDLQNIPPREMGVQPERFVLQGQKVLNPFGFP